MMKSFTDQENQGQMNEFDRAQAKKKAAEQMLEQKQTAEGEETQQALSGGGSLLGGIIGGIVGALATAGTAGAAAPSIPAFISAGSAIGGATGAVAGEVAKKRPSYGKLAGQTAQLGTAVAGATKLGSSSQIRADAGTPTMSPQGGNDPLSGVKKFSQNA